MTFSGGSGRRVFPPPAGLEPFARARGFKSIDRRDSYPDGQSQKTIWEMEVVPKLAAVRDKEKVREPRWTAIHENVSAVIAEVEAGGGRECLLSFWGEPFMAHTSGRNVPRYVFHIQEHSELISQIVELERKYRLAES